ncbi:hypothetical protein O6H91_19G071800 [Diphasiastrum complanatum]|uniref:Uncharacterized protein n=1 Tax=Diphasiastrum complanatum TaxID=34168 RepID=A0ACC2AWF6_DIPCM|nr:hypothetical protein O6H91_19G071800 [Diphasiastrum complanatum]
MKQQHTAVSSSMAEGEELSYGYLPIGINTASSVLDPGSKHMGSPNGMSIHGKKTSTSYIIFIALFASITSVMAGYCIGAISGAVLFIIKNLHINAHQEEVLMASLVLISIVGNMIAGHLADAIGRKNTMAFAAFVCLIGSIVMGIAPSFGLLLTGRLLSGISVGAVYVIVPLYVAEVSPPEIRGTLISLPEISLNFGILLGYLSGYLLSGLPSNINWRIMLGLGAFPAILLICGLPFIPESPRWLVVKGRLDEARRFLIKISRDKDDADQRLEDIVVAAQQASRSLDSDEKFRDAKQYLSNKSEHSVPLLDYEVGGQKRSVWSELLWPNAAVRRILIVAMIFQFFNQASGVPAVLYYSPSIFAAAGIKSTNGDLGSTVIVGCSKTVFVLVATIFVDRTGRRSLLFISGLGMCTSMAILGTAFLCLNKSSSIIELNVPAGITSVMAVVAVCSFVAFFSIGIGPISNLLIAELFPLKIRAQGMSLSIVLNRSIGGLISLSFLTLSSAITPAGVFFIFALVSAFFVIFVYTLVPETMGKTLEEIK